MLQTLLETGICVVIFAGLTSSREREIRVRGKGGMAQDIPILQSLVTDFRLHLGDRRTESVLPYPLRSCMQERGNQGPTGRGAMLGI